MESATMVELGGEWSSSNGVSINDEADFMAQLLFPNSSNNNQLDGSSSFLALSSSSSGGWTDHDQSSIGMAAFDATNTSFYSSDDSNLYPSFSQGSSSFNSGNLPYQQHHSGTKNYYLSDPHHQFLAANSNISSLPIDFCLNSANQNQLTEHDQPEFPDTNLQLKPEYGTSETHDPAAVEDKTSDLSEPAVRKRSRTSEKGKRNVKSRKSQRVGSDDEENDAGLVNNRQNSSSCSSEDETNDSRGTLTISLNGKSRASRSSATDPQSLYARKRRERINERLRILQSLVPNGTKVDISTMLEEAVQYVKFLQLQIKLLSSDDLWMYAPLAYNGMDIGRLEALDLKIKKAETSSSTQANSNN